MMPQRRCRTSLRGFTLVEVLVALAMSGVICAALLGLCVVLNTTTAEQFDARPQIINRQTMTLRVASLIRGTAKVLTAADDSLVLWLGDANGDGLPNLSELRLIARDPGTRLIHEYHATLPMAPGTDVTYSFADDFGAVAAGLVGTSVWPGETVVEGASSWSASFDSAVPTDARTVCVRITIDSRSGSDRVVTVASLRCSPR